MGGADKFNLDLIKWLTRQGYQFITCNTLPAENKWLPLFEPWVQTHINLPQQFSLPEQPQALVDIIRTRQIEVLLISNSYLGYLLLPLIRSHFPGLAIVDYLHMEEERWQNGGFPALAVEYQPWLDLTVVSTRHLKNWMIKRGGNPQKIEVCYTNIDPQEWNPSAYDINRLRADVDIEPDMPVLLYSGRIVSQKCPRIFAEVLRQLVGRKNLSFRCIVAGDGEDLPQLKRLTQQFNLTSYIHYLGEVSQERMKELHAMADIFFLPSQNEGLSLALFEAMSMSSVPVVADVGGQKELVTPECGYIVPQTDNEIEQYVTCLTYLIESAEPRRAMAAACRERIVTHFNLDTMGQTMHTLLQKTYLAAPTADRPGVSPEIGQLTTARAIDYLALENDFMKAGDYVAQIPDFTRADVVARRLPVRFLIGGLCLKILHKLGIKD
jgi:glycosyltransferase involved in cell wall biosynthesis